MPIHSDAMRGMTFASKEDAKELIVDFALLGSFSEFRFFSIDAMKSDNTEVVYIVLQVREKNGLWINTIYGESRSRGLYYNHTEASKALEIIDNHWQ